MRRPSRSGLQMTAGRRGRILSRVREDEAMGRLLVRWFISALALLAAAWLVPGIRVDGNAWVAYAGMAVVLGLVNAVIRPLLKLLTCPLILLTLGLFVLVVNALTLLLAAKIAAAMGIGFHVDGFAPAFLGALIVSVVTVILSAVAGEKD
jgi:putative membrane protein